MAITPITPDILRKWLANGEAILIDVREPSEYATVRIPGAHLIPLGEIDLTKLPKHAGKKLVIHCGGGKRSHSACEKLLTEIPSLELYNVEGGIRAWVDAGFETK
jgi:rhodanese-related sulfurtransferase